MSVTTTKIARTSVWRSKLHRVVKQKRILAQVTRLYPCQGSAVCIIATIWLREPLLRRFRLEVEDELRERCARWPFAVLRATISRRFVTTEYPSFLSIIPSEIAAAFKISPLSHPDGVLANYIINAIKSGPRSCPYADVL